jgi:hypothetical protein
VRGLRGVARVIHQIPLKPKAQQNLRHHDKNRGRAGRAAEVV